MQNWTLIPLSPQEIRKQRKLLPDFILYEWKACLPTKYKIKSGQTPQGVCRFIAKDSPTGIGEQSEANPYSNKKLPVDT